MILYARRHVGPTADRRPQQVRHDLSGALDGHELAVHEIQGRGPHPRSPHRRGRCLGGASPAGLGTAGTAPPLDVVLGHLEAAFTQVEDLTNLAAGDRSSAQRSPAVSAVGGDVGNHLVGIGDLGQILAWITRLLARVATRLALGSPAGGSRRWRG